MKTAAEMKSKKQSLPTIRVDLLDRLSDKAEEMTQPEDPSKPTRTARWFWWAA